VNQTEQEKNNSASAISKLRSQKNQSIKSNFFDIVHFLERGIAPGDWKKANISPIFKKGDKSSLSKYRPVSFTSQVCKALEAIIRDNIMDHIQYTQPYQRITAWIFKKDYVLLTYWNFLKL